MNASVFQQVGVPLRSRFDTLFSLLTGGITSCDTPLSLIPDCTVRNNIDISNKTESP